MAVLGYFEMALVLLLLLLLLFGSRWWRQVERRQSSFPKNWPVFGRLPAFLLNADRIHDYMTQVLKQTRGTFEFKGPWFAKIHMVVTADSVNVHHILSKNFSNYPKGPEFKKLFDILGEGIFNSDNEQWESHRRLAISLINHQNFHQFLVKTIQLKVEEGLIPLLNGYSESKDEADLQILLQHFMFEITCISVLGRDPACLPTELKDFPLEQALTDAEEAIFTRHMMPGWLWKLQRLFQIGNEKKLRKARETIDLFLALCISIRRKELSQDIDKEESEEVVSDLLTEYMRTSMQGIHTLNQLEVFLRDSLLTLIFAGKDTTSAVLTWFFWLISENPQVELKIREEIKTKVSIRENEKLRIFTFEEIRELVYLHGALCESLRLFPPIPIQHKAAREADVLPSGHFINKDTKILLLFYSMGRMDKIWGKDCLEFRPERWISERGGIKHEPSFKFTAFNAGPRSCIGKEVSFIQMKVVAAAIIHNFLIEVNKGHPVRPSNSVVLHMRHGLKVRIRRRIPDEDVETQV